MCGSVCVSELVHAKSLCHKVLARQLRYLVTDGSSSSVTAEILLVSTPADKIGPVLNVCCVVRIK